MKNQIEIKASIMTKKKKSYKQTLSAYTGASKKKVYMQTLSSHIFEIAREKKKLYADFVISCFSL